MEGYQWIPAQSGQMPPGAYQAGLDADGSQIYVGRSHYEGDLLPAKLVPSRNEAYVSYRGKERRVGYYEVLCGSEFDWVPSSGGQVPPGALSAGQTRDGEPLYVGRVWHEGTRTIGKVHPSERCCYIPYGGKELKYEEYDILTVPDVRPNANAPISSMYLDDEDYRPQNSGLVPNFGLRPNPGVAISSEYLEEDEYRPQNPIPHQYLDDVRPSGLNINPPVIDTYSGEDLRPSGLDFNRPIRGTYLEDEDERPNPYNISQEYLGSDDD